MSEILSQGSEFNINLHALLDIENEASKVKLWPEPRGFTYEIGVDSKGRMIQMSYGTTQIDGHVSRTLSVERVSLQRKHIASREPTIQEMTHFLTVVQHAMPGVLLVEIMRGDMKNWVNIQINSLLSERENSTDIDLQEVLNERVDELEIFYHQI